LPSSEHAECISNAWAGGG
jgi:secondary thiamine-phosphate synthase enzyme